MDGLGCRRYAHAGVAVDKAAEQWLLLARDAYFYRDEMNVAAPWCTPGPPLR